MDALVDFFDPLPIVVLFAVFIAVGLAFTFGLEALVHRRLRSETREPLHVGVLGLAMR